MLLKRLSILALCGIALSAAFSVRPASAAEKNVIMIIVDDQGKDSCGYLGNPVIQTPSLDALAGDSRTFDSAFCTTASCSASRSVINTGLYNHATAHYGHEHGYNHFRSYDNVRSMSVMLEEAGYRTCRIGKYHLAPEPVYHFEETIPCNSRSTVEMAEKCEEFLKSDDERPFFLYFCTSDPHRGGGVVESDPLRPDRFGNRDEGYPGVEEVVYSPEDVIVPPFLPDTPACRAELAQYYQSVSRIDQGVGRLMQYVKEADAYEDTMIIYISDNGIAFPGAKTTVYDPGICLPCIVRDPYSEQNGTSCDAMITWADLCPTILDFADATPQGHQMHGRSFLAALHEEECPDGYDKIYASHTFHEITMYYPMRVVQDRQYKLIWNIAYQLPYPFASDLWAAATWQSAWQEGGREAFYGKRQIGVFLQRDRFELYDMIADPHEVDNLADDPEHAELLETMQADLKAFQRRTKDPWVLKWNYE